MKIILIILLSFVMIACNEIFQCSIQQLQTFESSGNQESVAQCLREIIVKGQMSQTNKLTSITGANYKKILIKMLEEQMQRLKAIHQELVLGESTLSPVIKWGQNSSHIFINIKTSHRWDSPPCLNSKKQTVFLNQSLFQYINICIVAQQKITFFLNIDLYKLANINGDKGENGQLLNYNVNKNGVGMYSAVFQKLQYQVWPFLNKQNSTYQLWGQIIQRYPLDHIKYQQIWKGITKQRKVKSTKYQTSFLFYLLGLAWSLLLM